MKRALRVLVFAAFALGTTIAAAQTPGKSSKPQSAWKIALVPKDARTPGSSGWRSASSSSPRTPGSTPSRRAPPRPTPPCRPRSSRTSSRRASTPSASCRSIPRPSSPCSARRSRRASWSSTHEGAAPAELPLRHRGLLERRPGQTIMQDLAKMMGQKGVYTTMVGNVTNASHNEWADAGVAYQKAHYPNMTLLAAEPRVEIMDNLDTAYQRAKELFKKYPNLKGIIGHLLALDAPGTARAIEELGLKGKAFVTPVGLPNECGRTSRTGPSTAVPSGIPRTPATPAALAVAVLKGEKIANGLNLKAPGWTSMQFAPGSSKVLQGRAGSRSTRTTLTRSASRARSSARCLATARGRSRGARSASRMAEWGAALVAPRSRAREGWPRCPALLRVQGIVEVLRRGAGAQGGEPRDRRGGDPLPGRRERLGQVHPHQGDLRRPPARRGHHRARRTLLLPAHPDGSHRASASRSSTRTSPSSPT